jgi:hypothetical protein
MPHSLSDRARMGHVGPCIVSHRNAAERQQECEHHSAREATVGDVEVREVLQVYEVDDGAAADAGCTHQPVAQVADGSCQHQAECYRPADRAQPGCLDGDQYGGRHRHAGEKHGRGWRETEGSTGVPSDIDGQDLADYADRGLTLPGRDHERLRRLIQADTQHRGPGKNRHEARVHRHQASMASRTRLADGRRPGRKRSIFSGLLAFRSVDARVGVRRRSEQFVTSGSSFPVVHVGPAHPEVVRLCGSQRGSQADRPRWHWVMVFKIVRGSRSIAAPTSTFSISTRRVVQIIPRISRACDSKRMTHTSQESCPLPGHLGHSGAAICCVSLD